MTIREELLKIKGTKPLLVPEDVIKWARDHTKSMLHSHIPWDDAEAAHQHRLLVVRNLITLHIRREDGTPEIVSLSIDRPRAGGGYRMVEEVLKSRDMTEVMLDDALRELERVRVKYGQLKALAGIWSELDKARARNKKKEDA